MLRRAIALNPNYAPAHHWLSCTVLSTSAGATRRWQWPSARWCSIPCRQSSTSIWAARASVGRFDDALVAYRQAIEIDPAIATSYSTIGEVHAYGFGRFDAAIAWYEKAARLDPGKPGVPAELAHAYWELGDDTEARTMAR